MPGLWKKKKNGETDGEMRRRRRRGKVVLPSLVSSDQSGRLSMLILQREKKDQERVFDCVCVSMRDREGRRRRRTNEMTSLNKTSEVPISVCAGVVCYRQVPFYGPGSQRARGSKVT